MKLQLTNDEGHKRCPRCQRMFECRASDIAHCQCRTITLTEVDRHNIGADYQGCLCVNCLADIQSETKQATLPARLKWPT